MGKKMPISSPCPYYFYLKYHIVSYGIDLAKKKSSMIKKEIP